MAKIVVTGAAVVVKSAVKLDDYKKVKKYRPDALTLKDADGEPVFNVSVGEGFGSVNKYGAKFGTATADGFATITLFAEEGFGEDEKEAVAETVGPAILQLNKIEAAIPAVVGEIDVEKAAIMANIEFA